METKTLSFFAPHLKGQSSFVTVLLRELLSSALLVCAAFFVNGAEFILNAVVVIATVLAGDRIFQMFGFISRPKWELSLFHQAFLLILFLPANLPLEISVIGAFLLVSFYRFSGGRPGLLIQPTCVALVFLIILGFKPEFALLNFPHAAGSIVFVIWVLIRFPKTKTEIKRMAAAAVTIPLLCLLHDTPLIFALLWFAAVSDLLFDSVLAPLSASGRIFYWVLVLILFALFLSGTFLTQAMIFSAFIAGFLAAWIEERTVEKKA